jgi:fatty-acyl-CoA synthase
MSPAATTVAGHLAALAERGAPSDSGLRLLGPAGEATWLGWEEVASRASRAAGALVAAGVRPGDRVGLLLPTSAGFFDAWFGAMWAGAIPLALYPPVRLGRMATWVEGTLAALRTVGARAVVTDAVVGRVTGLVEAGLGPSVAWLRAERLGEGPPRSVHRADAQDAAMIQLSSGTTGAPKATSLSHAAILANAQVLLDEILRCDPVDGDPRPGGVSWLPLYHDMGLIGCVLPALLGPGPLTLIPPERFLARPALWLQAISTYRGTVSPAPNFAYALATERVRDDELVGVDLSSWSLALNGAEPVSARVCQAFVDRFSAFGLRPDALRPVYGLSEMALAVTFPRRGGVEALRVDPDALAGDRVVVSPEGAPWVGCGPPLPGYRVGILDTAGAPLPEDHVGRVVVDGPSALSGWFGSTAPARVDGWVHTGDLGFLHEGDLYVVGRQRDRIKLRGRHHAPQDLEAAADAVPGVRTGCAAAVADLSEDGERLLLFVEVREAVDGLADAVVDAVRGACGVAPDAVVLLAPGTLPRTSSGKIRRAEALAQWRAGTLVPPAAVGPLHLAGVLARSTLARWQGRARAWLERDATHDDATTSERRDTTE